MFDQLIGNLGTVFSNFRKKSVLQEKDITEALRAIRKSLLEADVSLPVVRSLVEKIQQKATGIQSLAGVDPAQQIVKIVHDELLDILIGTDSEAETSLRLKDNSLSIILMAGLQGSGKTTTSGKLAHYFKNKQDRKVLLASLDDRRPAAQEQLQILAQTIDVSSVPIEKDKKAIEIAEKALHQAQEGDYDILILDTAGRMTVDQGLMEEIQAIKLLAQPDETFLVADALTGQDAVVVADEFNKALGVTGIILTRLDGDSRGGAALSMRAVTGKPLQFVGVGEDIGALEPFHPERMAGRILGMGDVVSLVEKATEDFDENEALGLIEKFKKGIFDYNDLLMQMKQMQKMGGMGGIASLLPGMNQIKKQIENANIDEKLIKRQEAIISSMTKKERKTPSLVNHASRKKRIARGAGVQVNEVNKIIKMHKQMADMMLQMQKAQEGKGGMMGRLLKGFMNGAKDPASMPSEDELKEVAMKMKLGGKAMHKMGKAGMPQIPGMDLFGKKSKKAKKPRIRLR